MGARDIDTPSKAYTNSVPGQHSLYPDGQYTLELCTKCVMPEGQLKLSSGLSYGSKLVAIPVVHQSSLDK